MNTGVHMSLSVLVSLVCMPSSGIAGLYDSCVSSFSRNFHTVLYSGCTRLHSHQQCKRVPFTGGVFKVFYVEDHVICRQSFTSSFPIWIPFIYFSLLIAVA